MSELSFTVTERYLVLPVNSHLSRKNIAFFENGELIYDLDAYLDLKTPKFCTYADLSHLLGKTLTLRITPAMDFTPVFVSEIPEESAACQELRPKIHFSAKIGWINDPNGLVFHNGLYHLFFQHNPIDNRWGNMTWGHALSRDLIHWEEQSDAIFPDRLGTVFSGSAITDTRNLTGLKQNDTDPLLLYYTAAGDNSLLSKGRPFTQCLAYSLDNGKTFHKYPNNPIIPHVIGGNRDPKIIYCDELGRYLLALYLDADEYALFTSSDLLHFEEWQRLHLKGDDECPDLYPLPLEDQSGRKWIFSGASDIYLVGDMTENGFLPCQEALPYCYGRRTSYAAQTFSGTPNRRIKIAWDVLHAPEQIFENQMGIPCDVTLTSVGNIYRLRTHPVKELDSLRESMVEIPLTMPKHTTILSCKAYDIELNAANLPPTVISFFGHVIEIDPTENTLFYNGISLPLSYTRNGICLRMIVDTLGVEIFSDDGLIYTVKDGLSDYNLSTLTLIGKEQAPLSGTLAVYALKDIHN